MDRRRLLISLSAILTILTVIPNLVFGVNGSSVLYQLFLDWLAGKSSGILKVNVVPVGEDGTPMGDNFIVRVHNFTDYELRPHSEVVYLGMSTTFSLKVSRLLLRRGTQYGERRLRLIYAYHEYTVFVVSDDLKWQGAKLFRVEPARPLTEITVEVEMKPLNLRPQNGTITEPQLEKSGNPPTIRSELIYVSHSYTWMPGIQLHSIGGVDVWVRVEAGNYLFFSGKRRYLDSWYNPTTDWLPDGDKITKSLSGWTSTKVSDGEKRWIEVWVKYRYELWGIYMQWPDVWYLELVYPISFDGARWGDTITCGLCDGDPIGNTAPFGEGIDPPVSKDLGPGLEEIELYGIKLGIAAYYGPITVYVELWKEIQIGKATSPPKLYVDWAVWQKDYLVLFDDDSEWKIVHIAWRDTWP